MLLTVPALIGWTYLGLHVYHEGWEDRLFMVDPLMKLLMGLLPPIALLMMWVASLRMLRHATICTNGRMVALAVGLPLGWMVLAALILVGVPWVVGFGMMVVWSLQ